MFDFLKVGNHYRNICGLVTSMSQDDERVYRNQVAHLSDQVGESDLSEVGLFRARLFGAAFPVFAFATRWPNREKERADLLTFTIMQCTAGLTPGEGPKALPSDFLTSVLPSSLGRQTKLIRAELTEGPSSIDRFTTGFQGLLEMCHENLAISMPGKYDQRTKDRAHIILVSGLFTRLRLFSQINEGLR